MTFELGWTVGWLSKNPGAFLQKCQGLTDIQGYWLGFDWIRSVGSRSDGAEDGLSARLKGSALATAQARGSGRCWAALLHTRLGRAALVAWLSSRGRTRDVLKVHLVCFSELIDTTIKGLTILLSIWAEIDYHNCNLCDVIYQCSR